MGKLISELSPELQELVHKRQIEQGNDGKFDGKLEVGRNGGNFEWYDTSEGTLWEKLSSGEDVTNHPKYPKKLNYNYEIY